MASNNEELIAQFMQITGSDENEAHFYLAGSNFSLEVNFTLPDGNSFYFANS